MTTPQSIVVVSDLHVGCKLGLCPKTVRLDEGGSYEASSHQAEVMDKWMEFWKEWVPHVTKGGTYAVVINGDTLDGVHHNATTQWSHNLTDQKKTAFEMLHLIVSDPKCAKLYMIRGTEAHVGQSASEEESLAHWLGAIPNEDGNAARWELWLRFGRDQRLIHFTHHVGTTSSAAYESTAVYKEMVEAYNEAGRWGEEPPAIVVRSHRHRAFEIRIPTEHGYGIAFCTPGWQLKTPFTYRMALGRSSTPHIGGFVIRDGDEDGLYTRFRIWKTKRTNTETV